MSKETNQRLGRRRKRIPRNEKEIQAETLVGQMKKDHTYKSFKKVKKNGLKNAEGL